MKGKIKDIKNLSKKTPDSADARKVPSVPTQLYRVRQDIQKWRTGVVAAENLFSPQRFLLYQTYQDIVLDAHLSAAIQQRKNLTLRKSFVVVDQQGNINEEKTLLIRKKWFRDFLELSLDSIFYGFSLIQFDDIVDDEFKCVDLVPRIYVKPEFHIVTDNWVANTGKDYLEAPFKDWCIGVGKPKDLGLLMKAAPLIIWKKNAMGAWAEYVEIFGAPIRIGKTNVRDEDSRVNMENMLKNMAVAAYGVFDTDDLIELIETNRTDAYKVYDMMIQRCNSEISKLILGQTGTTDEKSFVGSAEVQERILEQFAESDEYFIDGVNNYQLVPFLNNLGFGFEGLRIECEADDEMSLVDKSKIDIELIKTGRFTMTPEYIKEKYNTEVIPVEPMDNSVNQVKNRLDKYYS